MNYKKRAWCTVIIMISALPVVYGSPEPVVPYYAIRSQGLYASRHASRNQAGLYPLNINVRSDTQSDVFGGVLTITPAYMRSFNGHTIARALFGIDQEGAITISGSRVSNRAPTDWLADYFYLPNDFKSTLTFSPVASTVLVDIGYELDLSAWVPGAYVNIYAPVAHSRFDLGMCEQVVQRGVNTQPSGMLAPGEIVRGQLLDDFSAYARGDLVQPVVQSITGKSFLTIMQQLKAGKISPEGLKTNGIVDIRVACGWNMIRDNYHVGFELCTAAPAGNRPRGIYLFEPMLGTGHHWELGIAMHAHYNLWCARDEIAQVSLRAYAQVSHLFTSKQYRTFDLVNSSFSRYMLAQKLDTPISNNLSGNGISPNVQFKQEFTPIANLSNIQVAVSTAVQADIVFALHAAYRAYTFDIGYNLWVRSPETIDIVGSNEFDGNKSWALKGDAQVFGYASAANIGPDFPLGQGQPVALSATQSAATIYAGTNMPRSGAFQDVVFEQVRQNFGIDDPQHAFAGGSAAVVSAAPTWAQLPGPSEITEGELLAMDMQPSDVLEPIAPMPYMAASVATPPTPLVTTMGAPSPIHTSIQPRLLSLKNLNICGARTCGLSNSVYGYFKYTGCSLRQFTPSIGIGGQTEWAPQSTRRCGSEAANTALNQWQLWLTLGFDF